MANMTLVLVYMMAAFGALLVRATEQGECDTTGCPLNAHCEPIRGRHVCVCDQGYSFTTDYTSCLGCGGSFTELAGQIKSNNFPNPYSNSAFCDYLIQAPAGLSIFLNFTAFKLERHPSCLFDYVQVYDGGDDNAPQLGERLCGYDIPQEMTSRGSELLVRFVTDYSVMRQGFSATYTATCKGGGFFSDPQGQVTSPGWPGEHPPFSDCGYTIRVAEGSAVLLTFTEFTLEKHEDDQGNCDYDYIEIYDGDSTDSPQLGGRLCGFELPDAIQSTSNVLYLRFVSDGNVNYPGFVIEYSTV